MPAAKSDDEPVTNNRTMARIMNQHFGKGNWVHDDREDVWMAPCTDYRGRGRRYICLYRDGASVQMTIPACLVH